MKEIGEEGQEKLKRSSVIVIGAGGLGSAVLTYLCMAGIGNLTIVDSDTVSITNLNRQFLHTEADIGRKKTESSMEKLKALNSEIEIRTVEINVNEDNAEDLIRNHDVVLTCVDNTETRMAVNRSSVKLGIPFIDGAIAGFYGQVIMILKDGACLECTGYGNTRIIKPVPVLGAVAGVTGSLQALLCIRLLLGQGYDNAGKIFVFDGKSMSLDTVEIEKDEACSACGKMGVLNDR